jgi:hypothetical protein
VLSGPYVTARRRHTSLMLINSLDCQPVSQQRPIVVDMRFSSSAGPNTNRRAIGCMPRWYPLLRCRTLLFATHLNEQHAALPSSNCDTVLRLGE